MGGRLAYCLLSPRIPETMPQFCPNWRKGVTQRVKPVVIHLRSGQLFVRRAARHARTKALNETAST